MNTQGRVEHVVPGVVVNLLWAGWVIQGVISIGTQVLFHPLAWCLFIHHCAEVDKAIRKRCFVSHRPLSREGGSVGRAKKKRNEHMKGSSASEGRAAKYESLVTWSFRS